MRLPITERERLVSAALRVIRADHYQTDDDPNGDAEAEYADDRLTEAARAFVTALDAVDRPAATARPATDGEPRDARTEFIKALRDLATFLTDHPDVPVPDHAYTDVTVDARGDDAVQWAFVDAAANAMGVTPAGREDTHFRAEVAFGPVTYKVLAIADQAMADCRERSRLGNEAFEAQREAATAPTGVAA
jgi:hypothetical protein